MAELRNPARLVIKNGGFEGMTFELTSAETLIGRNPTTDITLLDDGISREHAIILYDADSDSYCLEDLQSTNGTQVNGKRVRSVTLASGDEVRVGRTLFEFLRDTAQA
jgi:pSer/pThr/pTyr-binding forkhead associated (FHA) protein